MIDLEDARKRKLGAEARLAEIELLKAEEQIISVDAHADVIGRIGDLIRGRLTAIPSKTAPAVALESKQVICKQLIDDECRATLQELYRIISDDKFSASDEGKEEASKEVSSTTKTKRQRVGRPRTGTVI